MSKSPVHTIAALGNAYAVTREKQPKFSAIFQNNQLTDIVWQDAIPDNAEAVIKKALAFVNSHLTMQSKQ